MLIDLQNVVKKYPSRIGIDTLTVLDGISLNVDAAKSVAVTGRSGSGKSTLLNVIGCLDSADSGIVRIAGEDVSAMDESALAQYRNRQFGFVFQMHHLLGQFTALENVLVPVLASGAATTVQTEYAMHLLERVGLAERIGHYPAELSGGERQRVAIARALINRPALLLADEPTGSLDGASAAQVLELLLSVQQDEGLTLLVVTHEERLAQRMEQCYVLRDGVLELA